MKRKKKKKKRQQQSYTRNRKKWEIIVCTRVLSRGTVRRSESQQITEDEDADDECNHFVGIRSLFLVSRNRRREEKKNQIVYSLHFHHHSIRHSPYIWIRVFVGALCVVSVVSTNEHICELFRLNAMQSDGQIDRESTLDSNYIWYESVYVLFIL